MISEVDILETIDQENKDEGAESLKKTLLDIFLKTGLGPFLNLKEDLNQLSTTEVVLDALKIFQIRGAEKQKLLESNSFSKRASLISNYLNEKFSELRVEPQKENTTPGKVLSFSK